MWWNVILFLVLFGSCIIYALWRGGAPERIATGMILAGVVSTALVSTEEAGRFSSPEFGIFLVDFCVTLGLIALSLRANRFWPMWIAAVVAFGLLGHTAQWLVPGIMPKVYATAHAFSAYPMVLILAVGTFRHRRRLKTFGTDPAWSPRKEKRRVGEGQLLPARD